MSTQAATPTRPTLGTKKKVVLSGLDASLHASKGATRVMSKAMSMRRLITKKDDDLIRSGSTRQLLNRPMSSSTGGLAPDSHASQLASIPAGLVPPEAAESLATEDTADDLSESGSDFSGGSFSEADENQAADEEYLTKDLGASVHDDELAVDGEGGQEEAEDLIARMRNRMTVAEGVAEDEPPASS